MLKKMHGVVLAGGVAFLALWISGQCLSGANRGVYANREAYPSRILQNIGRVAPSIAWADKSWLGNDTSFTAVKNKIEKQIAAHQPPQTLLEGYREEAQVSPKDPQKVFAWAYSSRKAINPSMSFDEKTQVGAGVHQALLAVPFPNTYNYARMLFLTAEDDHRLVPAGERLLTHDMSDNEVKTRLVNDYSSLIAVEGAYKHRQNVSAQQRAVTLLDQLVRSDPKNPSYWSLTGLLYSGFYYTGKFRHPENARKSIAAYREYLRLAPLSAERRVAVEAVIKEIQEKMEATR